MVAGHVPGLVPHLDVPEGALLPVQSVPGPLLLDQLPGLRVFETYLVPAPHALAPPPLGLAGGPGLREGTGAPGPDPETVHPLWGRARTRRAGVELCEVGASAAPEHGGHQDAADTVLEAGATGLGAGGPGRVLGHHAVLWAGDEAGLLQTRLGLKVLTDGVVRMGPVRPERAAHLPQLSPLLPAVAQGQLRGPVGPRRDRHALVPGTQMPVVQVLVPVAHAEAVPLVGGPLGLVAVGVEGGPAVHVGTPDGTALAATGAAVAAHASPPRPWRNTGQGWTFLLRQKGSSHRGSKQEINPIPGWTLLQ